MALLPGLMEGAKLPEPIFSPTTKAAGHDEPLAYAESASLVGTVRACTEAALEFTGHPAHPVGLRIRQGDAIHPGRPAIGPDPFPRLPQHVTSADTVIQGVETPLRGLPSRSP